MTAIILILNRVLSDSLRMVMLSVIALSLCGIPTKGYARYTRACVDKNNLIASPGKITINTDNPSAYPVGTLIGQPYVSDYNEVFMFTGTVCSGTGTSTWTNNMWTVSTGTYSSPEGTLPVYPILDVNNDYTSFGFAMSIADPNEPYQPFDISPSKPLWSINGMLHEGSLGAKYKIYFVTTGPLAAGNYIIRLQYLAGICISSSQTSDTGDQCQSIYVSSFNITVNSNSCDINADTPSTVKLTRINASDLPKKGDVGNNVDFTISLKCNAATTVNMTLTDPNGGDAENGVLYSDKGDGLAENVGVQILSAKDGGQTPQTVHLNETFTVGNASEGQYSIPMAARYYRTSDSEIVGGKVSASVVYELSYQ